MCLIGIDVLFFLFRSMERTPARGDGEGRVGRGGEREVEHLGQHSKGKNVLLRTAHSYNSLFAGAKRKEETSEHGRCFIIRIFK